MNRDPDLEVNAIREDPDWQALLPTEPLAVIDPQDPYNPYTTEVEA